MESFEGKDESEIDEVDKQLKKKIEDNMDNKGKIIKTLVAEVKESIKN